MIHEKYIEKHEKICKHKNHHLKFYSFFLFKKKLINKIIFLILLKIQNKKSFVSNTKFIFLKKQFIIQQQQKKQLICV